MDNKARRTRPRRAPFPVPVGFVQGELTVLGWERHYSPTTGAALGWCPRVRCSCGTEKVILRSTLMRAKVKRCVECARRNPARGPKSWSKVEQRFPVGYRVGELTLVEWEWGRGKTGNALRRPKVLCACGSVTTVSFSRFCRGEVVSCRHCVRAATNKKLRARFGYSHIPEGVSALDRKRLQRRIKGTMERCHNATNKGYRDYGGRGIYVYPPWREDKTAYLAYLITLPGWDNPKLELDRIDNNRGYEPGNLRWATKSQNVRNRRSIAELQHEVNALRRKLAKYESKIGASSSA